MSKSAYERLAPFIREYIYLNKWQEMREIQVAACEQIFDTDNNLLLSSGTASGKTEAAFLPALTDLHSHPCASVGILYISPLKALINDQFMRLEELLEDSGIPLCKWHGDVSQTVKNKFLKQPRGVMQTTPESLEAMLMNRKNDVMTLFSDLRYVIIDEVHYFMNDPRGLQLLCILERIQRLTGVIPRRIGLSATLGDYAGAENWLNAGTNRQCSTPKCTGEKKSLKLAVDYFYQDMDYFEYLYRQTCDKKCILFSNSKKEVEDNIAMLKSLARRKKSGASYLVHHGNISAALREYTERQMKEADRPVTAGATLTLELGIDLGGLQRIVQTGSPFTVSSFVQRLGRTGRRGEPSEMCFAFLAPDQERESYRGIDWKFIKTIAIIQLYLEERWIEPIDPPRLPYSILYHQTMSHLHSHGEASPAELAQAILTLHVFSGVPQEDYKALLCHLLSIGHLELTEQNRLIIGLEGEKQTSHYDFYSVFITPKEYSVRYQSQEIGTTHIKFPVGEVFALGGETWKVDELDTKSDIIYVSPIQGRSTNDWDGEYAVDVTTKLMRKICEVLSCCTPYRYLSDEAEKTLEKFRFEAVHARITEQPIVKLSEDEYLLFPWLGTKATNALAYTIRHLGYECTIDYLDGLPLCIRMPGKNSFSRIRVLYEAASEQEIRKEEFAVRGNPDTGGKFDDFIPRELLIKEFISDFIDTQDMQRHLKML